MKKLFFLLANVFVFAITVEAQLTGTKNIPGDYATLALAITALNTSGVGAGGVTLNLIAGNPQTAPAGGYVIGGTGAAILTGGAATSAANPVIIQGNGNVITAFLHQSSGSLTDAIFKLIGADYITITGFTIKENAGNTTVNSGTNNMTEWGVALLYVSTTDGAQHNTIQNNTISLKNNYTNSFAIYSNVLHSATSPSVVADITSISGANSNNNIYSNSISNANFGIVFIGSATPSYMDNGNDIGGSSSATGNTASGWAVTVVSSTFIGLNNFCGAIICKNQTNENISYNILTTAVTVSNSFLYGIYNAYSPGVEPVSDLTKTMLYNTVTLKDNSTTANSDAGIYCSGVVDLNMLSININYNSIINCSLASADNGTDFHGIYNRSFCGTLNINHNIIQSDTSNNSSTDVYLISNSSAVANTVNINNNQCSNLVLQASVIYVISNVSGSSPTVNINNNSMDGITCSCADFLCVDNQCSATVAVNINYNQFGTATGNLVTFTTNQTQEFLEIDDDVSSTTCVNTVRGNDLRGVVHSVSAATDHFYITVDDPFAGGAAGLTLSVLDNTFTNLNVKTSGNIEFIGLVGNMVAGGSWTCTNNGIVTAFTKPTAGGLVRFLHASGSSVNGATMTETGNNFSNVTVTGATQIVGWDNEEGTSSSNGPTKTITNNTFSNISGATDSVIVMYLDNGASTTCSSNTISNITSGSYLAGIYIGPNNGGGTHNYVSNTINGMVSSGDVTGIEDKSSNIPTINISSNSISGVSTSGTSSDLRGIFITAGSTVNINSNLINTLTSTGTSGSTVNGIVASGGTAVNIYKNIIHTLSESTAFGSASLAVNGMLFASGASTTVTVWNNFISNLSTPAANSTNTIKGISIVNSVVSTFNLYNNSIYINASSTGANFGTSGIFHQTSAIATAGKLNLIDNIIVNTSTPKGTGFTAAYRISSTILTNYAATSNYNLFYAGTPGVKNVIFYDGTNSDQTLASYQARVNPRDANSISALPGFTSSTDLHITNANCSIDDKGTPIAGITDDIDADTRSVTVPDIGADEFTAVNYGVLAGSAGTKVCAGKAVVNTGTTYTDASCNLIVKVLPSGGTPVSGMINACVTIDPGAVQYFNAEPYVQRHYDIEPSTSNTTTTSATITLYFTDAEFIAFNAVSAGFPKLPTSALGNSDPNITNVRVTQYHGTSTTTPSSPGNYNANAGVGVLKVPSLVFWNATASRWEVTISVTGFSGFYVHTNIYNPLPITLNYLNGTMQNGKHLLKWSVTCNTTATATLSLERSGDARNFSSIYSITATALRCQQPFDYTDAQPLNGINYYRLKMTDAAGKITYSNTIALLNAAKEFELMDIAPNPVTGGTFTLHVTATQQTKMNLVICDMMGRTVSRQTIQLFSGYNNIEMHEEQLAPGIYNMYGTTDDSRSGVIRFIKQ